MINDRLTFGKGYVTKKDINDGNNCFTGLRLLINGRQVKEKKERERNYLTDIETVIVTNVKEYFNRITLIE